MLVVQSNIFYFTFNFLVISEIVPNLVPNMLLVKTLSKLNQNLVKFWVNFDQMLATVDPLGGVRWGSPGGSVSCLRKNRILSRLRPPFSRLGAVSGRPWPS